MTTLYARNLSSAAITVSSPMTSQPPLLELARAGDTSDRTAVNWSALSTPGFQRLWAAGKVAVYLDPTYSTSITLAQLPQYSAEGGAVSSVEGRTGIVDVTKADVGLGLVDNTSDAAKPIPFGALIQPMSNTVYPSSDLTLCTLSGTTPPNPWTGYAWSDTTRMTCHGAMLTDNGGSFGINRITGNPAAAYSPYIIEFFHSGTDVIIFGNIPAGASTDWQVWIDDQPAFPKWQQYGGGADVFGFTYLRMTFASNRVRRIQAAWSDANPFGGIVITNAVGGTIWAAPPRKKVALVSASMASHTYAVAEGTLHTGVLGTELATATGWAVYGMAQPGTSYLNNGKTVNAGNETYGHPSRLNALAALPALDAIIVFGLLNDPYGGFSAAQSQAAATSYFAALAAARPTTPVIVVGCENWEGGSAPSAATLLATDNAVAAAAAAAPNVRGFISLLQPKWWSGTGTQVAPNGSGNGDIFLANDGLHLSHDGQKYVAQRLAQALATVKV